MGLLDDFGIDLDPIEAPSYDVADDFYPFEITDVFIQNGTTKDADKVFIVIQYGLGDTGKNKQEWFGLPKDASAPTDKETQVLGFYKNRLRDLGIDDANLNTVGRDDLVGLRGSLQVYTSKGYQNIKNVKIDEEAPTTPSTPAAPAAKAPAARKPVAAKAAPAAAAEQAGVVANPFA